MTILPVPLLLISSMAVEKGECRILYFGEIVGDPAFILLIKGVNLKYIPREQILNETSAEE